MKEKGYNITFKPHNRTSILIDNIESNIVYAKNKKSAKELGEAIVINHYESKGLNTRDCEYMTKQYTYIIEAE